MKYRDKTSIFATILDIANGGASKSKIMSTAFLNHSSSLEYLRILLENNLLDYHSERRLFKTTSNGIRFLQLYNIMNELIESPAIDLSYFPKPYGNCLKKVS